MDPTVVIAFVLTVLLVMLPSVGTADKASLIVEGTEQNYPPAFDFLQLPGKITVVKGRSSIW